MVWDAAAGGQASQPGLYRFTVTLTQPILAEDGSIALPAGTTFIAEVSNVNPDNNLVIASAVAVLYRDQSGTVQQQALPPGAVLIRGKQGSPLIAENLHNPGGAIAGQDLLVAALSSLGRIGEIINQPQTQTVTSGLGYSQTSTRSDPEIWAAALEGAFGTTAERLSDRSDQMIEEMLSRPNVIVLTPESDVSVVVNSFFQVRL